MVQKRFGLTRRPFPPTTDETVYYPATGHEAALSRIHEALTEEEGFALLTGVPGVGKTLVGYCLLERLGPAVTSAFITNSRLADRTSLLQAILFDLGLPFEAASEQPLRLRFTEFLLKNRADDKRTVLIADEAHHLSADLLEELRLLGNLEAGGKKAIQIVFLAQSPLLDVLRRPELASLNQRLCVRAEIEPLPVPEAVDYMLHHLRAAGGNPQKIFDEAALEVLARGTRGVPRLINQAAQQALLLAESGELERVDAEAALEALSMVGLEVDESAEESEAQEEAPAVRLEAARRTA